MFFDEATIEVRAGLGGNGCVSFRREKYVPLGGPNGGHGGRGGHVYLKVDPQLNTLVRFSRRRHFIAKDGVNGMGKGMHGANGKDLYVPVPAGTLVRDRASGEVLGDLTHENQTLLVAEGGRGGRGNEAFKSSTRQAPQFAENGAPGEERVLRLELKLIADVGLLGKPNAGKSTLLASVSAARPKIADYPFTTLQPNLGVVVVDGIEFVMADIPGLIEGASEGAGLGHQFLRHVERTRLLIHLLDGAGEDPGADYVAINAELAGYSAALASKPQIVVLNKADLTDTVEWLDLLSEEAGLDDVHLISAVTGAGVQDLMRLVAQRLETIEPEPEPLVVLKPHLDGESQAFTITQLDEGIFRLEGEEIERLAMMTDWFNEEAAERFERIMISRGISEQMDAAGVMLGDTVRIGEIELEWR